jgi:hypothetical protein
MASATAWAQYTQNELDALVKRDLYSKTKTDDVVFGQQGPDNEPIFTSMMISGDNVWVAGDVLKTNTPQQSVDAGLAEKRTYVKMTSLYGADSNLAVAQAGVAALAGVSWQANNGANPSIAVKNWIDGSYGIAYTPLFLIVARTTTPAQDSSNLTSSNSANIANNSSCPFTFDCNTGVLTFLNTPAVSGAGAPFAYNLRTLTGTNPTRYTTYDLYVSGYTYKGPTVTNSTYSGGTGGGGASTQLVQNIGLNAYVNGATGSSSYLARNGGVLTYNLTLYGNSTVYDILMNYNTTPLSVSGAKTVLTTADMTSELVYNNSGAQGTAVYGNKQNVQTITHAGTITGLPNNLTPYNIPVTLTTTKAGGTGLGSTFTFNVPIKVSQPDNMGNADITVPFASTFTWSGATGWVDGISYFISPTTITIPAFSVRVTNMFNIVGAIAPGAGSTADSNTASTFTYFTASGAASGSDTATDLVVTNNRATSFANTLITSSPGGYAPGGTGYTNGLSIQLTVSASNSAVYGTFNNILNQASAATLLFPSADLQTYSGTASYMGYFSNSPALSRTAVGSGPTVGGFNYCTRISMGGYIALPPTLTGLLSNNGRDLGTIPANPTYSAWNNYDAVINPLDYGVYGVYTLNGSDFTTNLNRDYILPSTALWKASASKYVALRINTSAKLGVFRLSWSTPTSCTVVNVRAAWVYNSVVYGWYDGTADAGTTSTGCDNTSSSNTVRNFKINATGTPAPISNYQAASGGSTTDIYVIIEFTGKITLNSFVVS